MTEIRATQFGVGNQYYTGDLKEGIPQKAAEEKPAQPEAKKQVASGDVLNFMANAAQDLVPVQTTRTYNVSKYVTAEQEARIAGLMADFEAQFEEAFSITQSEFPDLTEAAAGEIALACTDAVL